MDRVGRIFIVWHDCIKKLMSNELIVVKIHYKQRVLKTCVKHIESAALSVKVPKVNERSKLLDRKPNSASLKLR